MHSNESACRKSGRLGLEQVTSHFTCDAKHFINVKKTLHPLTVTLTNGDQIHSSHTDLLYLPSIPPAARKCHIFPQLKKSPSLYWKILWFRATRHLHNQTIIHLRCQHALFAWTAQYNKRIVAHRPGASAHQTTHTQSLQYPPAHGSSTITTCSSKHRLLFGEKRDIVTYLHRACFSPVPST